MKLELDLTESELSTLTGCITSDYNFNRSALVEHFIENSDRPIIDFLSGLKSMDSDKYEKVLQNTISQYINLSNILYEINGFRPTTDELILHKHIIKCCDIPEDKFDFSELIK